MNPAKQTDMRVALGFIELPNLCDAIELLDTLLKSADVTLETWEKRLGGRLVTLIVSGSTASVTTAVEAAKQHAPEKIAASLVIANPHAETWRLVRESAAKNTR